MHTSTYVIEDYGEVLVHHNSDWSGDVIINWFEHDSLGNILPQYKKEVREPKEAIIPGFLLKKVGEKVALDMFKDALISFVEQYEDPDDDSNGGGPAEAGSDEEVSGGSYPEASG